MRARRGETKTSQCPLGKGGALTREEETWREGKQNLSRREEARTCWRETEVKARTCQGERKKEGEELGKYLCELNVK